MSGVIIRWNTETYEAEAKLEIEGGFKWMVLLERKESPLIIAGVRDSIVYVDPFKLEIVKTLESVHVAHLHQIVGLNKFENEYFVSQDWYSAIKVFHVDSGECCISIESTGWQLNDHVTNTLIELENPYVELFNSGLKLREEDDSEIFKEESSHQSEMEEEQYAMIAVSVPFKSGWALAIYKLDPISKTHSIVKVLNKKGPKISKGFSLLQLKGGIVAYSNYGEIEIINLWEDFKVLKKSINSEDPVRKMLLVNKRRRTNVLKEHPLGSFNLMSVGYRSELNLWNVDFKQAGEAMEKAEASRELKHKK